MSLYSSLSCTFRSIRTTSFITWYSNELDDASFPTALLTSSSMSRLEGRLELVLKDLAHIVEYI